jgi:4-hydroxybenzoate polyprenyltransferase
VRLTAALASVTECPLTDSNGWLGKAEWPCAHQVGRDDQPVNRDKSVRQRDTGRLAIRSDAKKPRLMSFIADPTATERSPAGAWLQALRLHHWSKNLFVFVPVLLGHVYTDADKVLSAGAAFLILGVLVSAGYLINDIADLAADRQHESKRHRPLASGRISTSAGITIAIAMIVVAFAAAVALSRGFAVVLLAYFLLTVSYSLWLKKLALIDVAAIATMLALRIAAGGAVTGIGQSPWLLSFSTAFFLSLALAKRHCEIRQAAFSGAGAIAGRGFHADDWPLTLAFGVSAGLISILIMLLYLANDAAPSGFYPHQGWLYVVPAAVLIWLMRVWMLSQRRELHDDPVIFALKDPASLAFGVIAALAFVLAV